MVLSGNVIAFKNVLRDPFTSSTKGSLRGNSLDPHKTECSSICATPVESVGGVLNPIEKTLLLSSFSMIAILAPVFLWERR